MMLNGKDLLAIGFKEGKSIGLALAVVNQGASEKSREEKLQMLQDVLYHPQAYLEDRMLQSIAQELLKPKKSDSIIPLKEEKTPYTIYGKEGIERGAKQQMEIAMKLPVSKAGALMPDAHQGYGLPIGGVLATENAIIPYGVGMDIGCRMCLSVYALPPSELLEKKGAFKQILLENTRFGRDTFENPKDHEVLTHHLFQEIPLIKGLKDKAFQQIGTSGGGNHFVEFGIVDILDQGASLGINPGTYLAVLSHSGSRGFGGAIAQYYTKLAKEKCKLPKEAQHLAWLDLNTEAGQEYWLAMNLAGDYASACHHQIHKRLAEALGEQHLLRVENHHNFAWKEKDAWGNEIIVHRKGATPAGKGCLGIIPGSMTAPGFIVQGKGEITALNSASHGAGRQMSRTKAIENLNKNTVSDYLSQAGVEVIGSGLDEAPMAYKDIHQVMAAQDDLVEILGSFLPKIVRMCGEENFYEGA